ncbi:methylated-DNA--[protein]-cysteine S-methyltransferase [Gordonia sp. SL306]|uniref:methylated-DNA--[protein]-cysteine S-methyltransferase n=1 Tax=Gordonia sp. SL306 TaxID=2995145 RepID=UPI00226FCAAF|nr:methylated-DNA--[protein]-cysteine S-methyltransferase [Gordonia sp. SL306]WAC53551.1 methylated-DNA--[protein]-cysteine S-methyltransferase [Gordonia sp. SL306]
METVRHAVIETSLGDATLVADDDVLVCCYLEIADTSAFGERVVPLHDPVLSRAVTQFEEYLAGERTDFDVPLRADGDEFSERVWALLQDIPYGRTTTYGRLALRLGDKFLAQRVGRSLGQNPISVFIPCHRVIGADGSLTGYAGGLERKRLLLELEEPPEVRAGRLF